MMNRYNRHIVLDDIGVKGQEKISGAKVLVVGAGGLGCPVLLYLAAAGVGQLGIIDFDNVEVSNLQRQVLFGESNLGLNKALAAKVRLSDLNSEIELRAYPERLTPTNAVNLFSKYDLVIDGSDNFATRYLVNDACIISGKPMVYGAIYKFEGQVSVFNKNNGPSYRCLFPVPPRPGQSLSCDSIGVLGVLPGIIGSMMANEALKIILDKPGILSGKMLCYDSRSATVSHFKITRSESGIQDIKSRGVQISNLDYHDACDLSPKEISAQEAIALDDAVFYDLREPHEQPRLDITDFKRVPMGKLGDHLELFDHDHPKILVCQSGIRSLNAVSQLEQYGVANCFSLKEGALALNQLIKFNYE